MELCVTVLLLVTETPESGVTLPTALVKSTVPVPAPIERTNAPSTVLCKVMLLLAVAMVEAFVNTVGPVIETAPPPLIVVWIVGKLLEPILTCDWAV